MFTPVIPFASGEMYQLYIQRSVSKWADVLNLRGSDAQHLVPSAGIHRHAEPSKTGSAAITLVQYDDVQRSGSRQKIDEDGSGPGEILTKPVEFYIPIHRRIGEKSYHYQPNASKQCGGQRDLGREEQPILHGDLDSGGSGLVAASQTIRGKSF